MSDDINDISKDAQISATNSVEMNSEENKLFDLSIDILKCQNPPINQDILMTYDKHEVDNIDKETKKIKIMKFSSEWKCDEVVSEIERIEPSVYENLFVFIFEFDEISSDNSAMQPNEHSVGTDFSQIFERVLNFGANRPLLLQITSTIENVTKIYYKEDSSFEPITQPKMESAYCKDFSTFLCIYKNVENFESEVFESIRSGENSLLTLRFLRVLELPSEFYEKLILECSLFRTKNELLAALDVPFGCVEIGKSLQEDENDFKKSIFINAIENSNPEIREYLVRDSTKFIQNLPFDQKVSISTKALQENRFDFLCRLIKDYDFPFPENFNQNNVTNENLKMIAENRTEFHKAITDEDLEKLKQMITKTSDYRNIKYAYDIKNITAIDKAYASEKFRILIYLKSAGLDSIYFDEYFNSSDEIKKWAKMQRKVNFQSAQPNIEKSISLLSARTSIHNYCGNTPIYLENYKKIREWYEDIYKIDENRLLLDVVASCKELQIIFDFKSESTSCVDLQPVNTEGTTYVKSKRIVIAADYSEGAEREQRVKGVIAHEFCHYGMKLIFENQEKPYYKEDKESQQKFTEITNEIDVWSEDESDKKLDDECNNIVSGVFTGYEPESFQPELIVRVPQMLTEFGSNQMKIVRLEQKYDKLFDYYRNRVMPAMIDFLKSDREIIRKLNNDFGIMPEIKNFEYRTKNLKKMQNIAENPLTVFKTNHSKLLLFNIYRGLKKQYGDLFDAKNIFVSQNALNNSNKLKEILAKNQNLRIVVECSKGIEDDLTVITSNPNIHFVFIVSNENDNQKLTKLVNAKGLQHQLETNEYYWNDLEQKSQQNLLNTKIKFREHEVPLNDLLSKNSKIGSGNSDVLATINDNLLSLLINKSEIPVNKSIGIDKNDKNFKTNFIPRILKKFSKGQDKPSEIKQLQLMEDTKNSKIVLISDIAGAGKSWFMRSIAESIADHQFSIWVSLIDLKQFIKEFKSAQTENIDFPSFMLTKLLKLKAKYEKWIFEMMYDNGRVCILFDGFDEIAPNCAEFVTQLAKSFLYNGGNQLWIATRDYCEVNLQEELDIEEIYKLESLTKEEEIDLITYSWVYNDLDEEELEDIESRVGLEKLINETPKYASFREKSKELHSQINSLKRISIGIPQFYTILVAILKESNEILTNLTIYQIYQKFVEIKFKAWSSEKGKEAYINVSLNSSFGFQDLHEYFALRNIYPENDEFCYLEFDEANWPDEGIAACGLLTQQSKNFYFLHETFREFFAAKFFLRYLPKRRKLGNFYEFFIDFIMIRKYTIIRIFLNDALDDMTLVNKIKFDISKISELFYNSKSCCWALEDIFKMDLKNLQIVIKNILECGSKEGIKEFFFNSHKTIMECAKGNCTELVNLIISFIDFDDAIDLFAKKTELRSTFLNRLVSNGTSETIIEIFKIFKQKFNEDQYCAILKQKSNLLHSACKSKELATFKFFWESYRNLLATETEFSNFLQKNAFDGNILLHCAAKYSTGRVFEFLITESEKLIPIKTLIFNQMDRENNNLLQLAVKFNESVEFHKTFWKIIREYFPKEILEMIKHKNEDNKNCINLAVENNTKEVLKFLWNEILMCEEVISKNELLHLITEGSNIFYNAVELENKEILEFLRIEIGSFIRSQNALEYFKRFLTKNIDSDDNTILHFIAKNHEINLKYYETFWKMMEETFENKEELVCWVLQNNKDGDNAIHILIMNNNTEVVEKFFDIFNEIFNNSQMKEIIKSKRLDKYSILQLIADYFSYDLKRQKFVWKIMKSYLDFHEIFELVGKNYKFINGFPFWASEFRSLVLIKELLNAYKEYLETKDIPNAENVLNQCDICIQKFAENKLFKKISEDVKIEIRKLNELIEYANFQLETQE